MKKANKNHDCIVILCNDPDQVLAEPQRGVYSAPPLEKSTPHIFSYATPLYRGVAWGGRWVRPTPLLGPGALFRILPCPCHALDIFIQICSRF